jgi:hypothetical protein
MRPQVKRVQGQPITGSRTDMRPRPPVLSDAADTSRDAQKQILQPPQPFANRRGAEQTPAPANASFGRTQVAGLPAKNLRGGSSHGGSLVTHIGCANTETTDDMLAAVGEPRKPKGYQSIISGSPLNAPRKVGGGNFPKAKRRG